MQNLNDVNTSLEAHKLVKDPAKLLSMLYSKYGDSTYDLYCLFINQVLYKCSTHFNTIFQENKYNEIREFLKKFYIQADIKKKIINYYHYYFLLWKYMDL